MAVTNTPMTIGLCGFISAGKDSLADILETDYGFVRSSHAGPLKDAVASLFGYERELVEGRTDKSREFRNQNDEFWTQKFKEKNPAFLHFDEKVTCRLLLQKVGMILRDQLFPDIFIDSLECRNVLERMVITDCRFPNEIHEIKKRGGKVVWIERGPRPAWFDEAVAAATFLKNGVVPPPDITSRLPAPSEWAWLSEIDTMDYVLDNNKDGMVALQSSVCKMMDEFKF